MTTRFALIGGGWRAAFYLRIAALPDRFETTGLLTRDPGRREAFAREFDVATPGTLDDLLAATPDSAVRASGHVWDGR